MPWTVPRTLPQQLAIRNQESAEQTPGSGPLRSTEFPTCQRGGGRARGRSKDPRVLARASKQAHTAPPEPDDDCCFPQPSTPRGAPGLPETPPPPASCESHFNFLSPPLRAPDPFLRGEPETLHKQSYPYEPQCAGYAKSSVCGRSKGGREKRELGLDSNSANRFPNRRRYHCLLTYR